MRRNGFPRIQNLNTSETIILSGRITTFGSSTDCHVHVDDKKIPSRAAHCIFSGGEFSIQPLDTARQLRINGEPLKGGHRLAHGDKISLGTVDFEFQDHESNEQKRDVDLAKHPVEDLISVCVTLLRNRTADVSGELVASVSRLLRCDAARLVEEDEDSGERKTVARFPEGCGLDRFSARAIDWAKSAGNTVLVADIDWQQTEESMTSLERNQISSVMCAPLIAADNVTILGYLYLDRIRERNKLFTEKDRRFCDTLVPFFTEILSNAQQHARQRDTIARLQSAKPSEGGILFESAEMERIVEQARKVARTDSPALVLGQTGTGKELMARF
ncbi:MAG: FHA domain-containing protein, partial [Chitinivibrionales bacterium]